MYKALTYVVVGGKKYAPGDKITKKAFVEAEQEDSIAELLDGRSLSEDMDAAVHPDHAPVKINIAPRELDVYGVSDEDAGEGDSA